MINKTNLLVDIGILAGFLVAAEPGLTGLPLHEWLGLAFTATIVLHLLLHWKWITSMTIQFFKKLFHTSRLQYVVDAILFVSFTAVILSGLMISRVVLPFLNIAVARNFAWTRLHAASASTTLLMIALHTALHWDWVTGMTRRYLIAPVLSITHRRAQPELASVRVSAAQDK